MPPVRVAKEPRTLWVQPQDPSTSCVHTPFKDMFDGVLLLKPESIIRSNDVIVFDGGTDVNPELYGEKRHVATGAPDLERDKRERYAFRRGKEAGAKFLGVCRGAQFLCVMSGGKLVQHVSGHYNGGHMMVTDDGEALWTESSHHQVMWPYEIPHVMIAWADQKAQQPFVVSDEYGKDFNDGQLPEIIYCSETKALCIQGHSEWSDAGGAFVKLTRKLVQDYLLS